MTPETTAAILTYVRDEKRQDYTWNHDRYLRGDSPQTTWRQLSDGLALEVEALEQAIQDVAMTEKFARAIVEKQWSAQDGEGHSPVCPWCNQPERNLDFTPARIHAPDCVVREALAVLARIEAEGKP